MSNTIETAVYPDDSPSVPTPAGTSVVVALLGGVATRRDDGALLPLPGARARSLLAALAMHTGRVRSSQALIDDIWGDQPPRAPMNALHTQVSRLRAALPEGAIEMSAAGYRLALPKHQVDLSLARSLEQRAQQLHAEGAYEACLEVVAQARALWRGEPGADLPAGELARELADSAHARLAALDAVAVAAHLASGDAEGAIEPARAATQRSPLDEAAHVALMRVLARAGRPNEALEVFAALRTRLADELGADPGSALVELNTAILRGELPASPSVPAPAPEAEPRPLAGTGLRLSPNPLLGRDTDLDALDALTQTARVTTILGPGGTGKTRVANELGQRWVGRTYVALVELASVRSGDDVLGAIGSTLGIGDVERVRPAGIGAARVVPPKTRLRDALNARPTLLILDNCEHVIEQVADLVAELIGVCARLRVLTTSRAPLMITAESVYPLAPLYIDEHGSPATELFVTRARAVRPSVRLDRATVAELCRTLDGLPLAIELAAARVRSMGLDEIKAGLGSRFALLRGGDRTSPARHRTLYAVIDWSWNLLDPAQRAALRRLCRFPAGFTAATAGAVAGWDEVSDIDHALDGLVNQSLLTVVESPETGRVRYRMLETVREFGEEQLRAAGEEQAVVDRMADWARRLALGLAAEAYTERQVTAAHTIHDEQENLVAVLREAASRPRDGDTRDADATVCVVFSVLAVWWMLRDHNFELVPWAPRILEIDPRQVDAPFEAIAVAIMLAGGSRTFASDFRSAMLARLRLKQLLAARTDGKPMVRFQAAVGTTPLHGRDLPRLLADNVNSADDMTSVAALLMRANLFENLGNMHGSLRDALRGLAIAERCKDLWTTSMFCQHIASNYAQLARYDEAVTYCRRTLDSLRQLLAYEQVEQHSCWLATSLVGGGRLVEARAIIDDLRTSNPWLDDADHDPAGRQDAGDRLGLMAVALAELELAEGNSDQALAHYGSALRVSHWPISAEEPGPFGVVIAGAAICAHVAAGRAAEIAGVVDEIVGIALFQFPRFPDYPQAGVVAVAVAIHGLCTGADPERCATLLALATKVTVRQDFPSIHRARSLAARSDALPPHGLDAALRDTASLSRHAALQAILDHIKVLYPRT